MPPSTKQTPNKIFCGLPLYGPVPPEFIKSFITFSAQLGKHHARYMVVSMPYVEVAETFLVDNALLCKCGHVYTSHRIKNYEKCRGFVEDKGKVRFCDCKQLDFVEDFDYLVFTEHDNVLPDGWLDLVESYNPKTQPIVALPYFGKTADDQRPIPGYLRKHGKRHIDGMFERLTEDELKEMGIGRDADPRKKGVYSVDVVGMGATAIHRDVLLNWPRKRLPWFQTKHVAPSGFMGQDVLFCREAKKQGYDILLDTRLVAKHIGTWQSDEVTYGNSMRWQRDQKNGHVG